MSRRVLTDPTARRGRASRVKGHGFEREMATRFREELGLTTDEVHRGLGQARSKGEVPDVVAPHLWVECKRGKKVNIRAAMEQATSDEAKHKGEALLPIVIGKEDHKAATVTVDLEVFFELYKGWLRSRGELE